MKVEWLILRLIALFCLGVSGLLLGEYLFGASDLCSFQGTCGDVIHSDFGHPLGVPLPVVGLVGFGLLLGLSLFPGSRAFALVGPLAVAAGLAGLALLLVQGFVLGKFCRQCLVVDASAIGLAAVALTGWLRRGAPSGISWLHRSAWLAAAVAAIVLPPLWVWTGAPPPVPEQVKGYWVEGKITVVDVTDFECPSCRGAEPALAAFRKKMGDKIHFVRLVAPIQRHVNARPAGRAFLAAQKQGKGEAMAEALFAAQNLEPAECRKRAAAIGLNLAEYDKAVSDPATEAVLDTTDAWMQHLEKGVPMVWVGDQLVSSPVTPEKLSLAYRRALRSAAGIR